MMDYVSTPLSLVAVDIGNSSVHFGLFAASPELEPPQPTAVLQQAAQDVAFGRLLERLPTNPCRWRIASVRRDVQQHLAAWVRGTRPGDDYRVLSYSDLPLAVEVDYPERVGLDRLAAAVAVNCLRSAHRPAIVVNAGTALTVDLVGAAGAFLGGVILPGFQMAARALANDTDLLPLASFSPNDEPPPVVGRSTEAAIRSGLFWGAVGAIHELADRMGRELQSTPEVFVTGGDAQTLAVHLGAAARYVPNLVLTGIALAAGSSPGQ